MANIRNIFNSIQDKNRKLKICLLHFDQKYETLLAKTGHDFYIVTSEDNPWDDKSSDTPDNFYLLKGNMSDTIAFDIIICGGRFTNNANIANQIRSRFRIPCLFYENAQPWSFSPEFKCIEDIPKRYLQMLQQTSGDVNIFSSDEIEKSWSSITNNNLVVPYGDGLEDKFLTEWETVLTNFKEIQ